MNNIIYIGSFFIAFINYTVNISIPIYLTEKFYASPLQLGIAGFTMSFAYTLTVFIFSKFHSSRKFPWFIYACSCIGILYLLLTFYSSLFPFFLILLLLGFSYGRFWPSLQSYFSSSREGSSISTFNLSWSAGVIFGALFAGNIYSIHANLPFFLSGALALLTFILFFSYKKDIINHFHFTFSQKNHEKAVDSVEIKKVRLLNFLNFFVVGAIVFLFPRLALDLNFSIPLIGRIIAILLICRFATFFLLKKSSLLKNPAIISCFALFVSCVLIGIGKTPYVHLISMILIGVFSTFSYHNSILLHLRANFPMEIHEGVIGAGLFSGPLIAGIIGQLLNLQWAFIIIGIGILIVGIFESRKGSGLEL